MFASHSRHLAAASLLCLLSLLSAPAGATITTGGDAGEVSPANPATWTNGATGTLGRIGIHSGKSGTVTVAGGSHLLSSNADLGELPGASGTATITGANSTWTNTYNLYVGVFGTGTLNVNSGAVVTTNTLIASWGNLKGDGTINAKGLIVDDVDLVFDAAHRASQVLSFGTGGTLNLNLDGTGELGAGFCGTGSLRVADGVSISSSNGILGNYPGSTGNATVTGPGSTWANSGNLNVGQSGAGVLTVESGGTVSSSQGFIGGPVYVGGGGIYTGAVTVTGAGSNWTNSGNLFVGRVGISVGTLTVQNGATVTTGAIFASLNDLKGDGTINAKGMVCDADLVFDATHGTSRVFSFGTGGTLNLNPDGTADFGVGGKGSGTMVIADGVVFTSNHGYLGYDAGSSGIATITGAGSTWASTSVLCVGNYGAGTLKVANGGKVTSNNGYIGSSSGSTGSATIAGTGSTWTGNYMVDVGGVGGTGTLTVGNGGKVIAVTSQINSTSRVNLHVSGSGMIMLNGNLDNSGKVNLYADAFQTVGTYSPITGATWSGMGSYNAYGGTWNSSAHIFTVAAAKTSGSGVSNTLTTGERLLITDSTTGKRVGASFGTVAGGTNFSAAVLSGADLSGLPADQSVLGAWNFTTNFAGDQALLSFDIGAGQTGDLSVWHYDGTTWTPFAAPDLTYGDDGIANFAVTSFSGYAVTAAVPEPGSATLIVMAGLALLRRSHRK